MSGQPFDISIGIINPHVGNDNEGIITFQLSLYSSFLNEFGDQNNITFWQDNFVENSPMDVSVQYDYERIGRISNITITDLGSPPTLGEINSDNIEGSYEGTLYFLDDNTAGTPDANFNIPVPIRISFSALRGN